MDAVFVAISFVGSDALAQELGSAGVGVIVSQVVPFPGDRSVPVVAAYQKALAALAPDARPGFVSLEGYVVGLLVIEALKRIPGEPTREAPLDAIANTGAFDFGGIELSYGPSKNQGSDRVFFTILQADGSFKPVARLVKMARE
jgi:branched-chain amino acid transport system substrate-binding protein